MLYAPRGDNSLLEYCVRRGWQDEDVRVFGDAAGILRAVAAGKVKVPRKAFLRMLDAIEEFKHAAATESVRAGLAAARKRGARLGRPQTVNAHRGDVARLRARGMTGRAIAKELGIPSSTAFKLIKAAGM